MTRKRDIKMRTSRAPHDACIDAAGIIRAFVRVLARAVQTGKPHDASALPTSDAA